MADAARAEETWTFFEGAWHPGNVRMMGPRTHAAWLASTVFDGARAFEGVTPDLDLHLARINRSAAAFGLEPVVAEGTWAELVRDGLGRFAPDAALYIRPMYWAEGGLGGAVRVGFSLESGAVGGGSGLKLSNLPREGWKQAASGFLSVDTRFGPFFLALGGTVRAIGSAELKFPGLLPESYGIGLSLFTDFGTMGRLDNLAGGRVCTGAQYSGVGTCVKDNLAFRGSAGISVQWKSPFGPVQIDLGLPYAKTFYDRAQIIHFSTATGY